VLQSKAQRVFPPKGKLVKKYDNRELKVVFCVVFSSDDDDDDHGVRRANTARALARWRRLGASHEATDALHRAMCLAPYCTVGMVIVFVVESVTFYFFVD
jgi:hypothetical protein